MQNPRHAFLHSFCTAACITGSLSYLAVITVLLQNHNIPDVHVCQQDSGFEHPSRRLLQHCEADARISSTSKAESV